MNERPLGGFPVPSSLDPFRVEEWLVSPALNHMERDGVVIRLEPRLMHVLVCLASRAGEMVSRNELLDTVWDGVVVNEESLTHSISKLRNVFGDESRSPRFIETIPKRGYRLVATVTQTGKTGMAKENGETAAKENQGVLHRLLPVAAMVLVAIAAITFITGRGRESSSVQSPIILDGVPFTSAPGREAIPSISPDGTRVAFTMKSENKNSYDLYIKQINREESLQLTDMPGAEYMAAWSPDGTSIAFIHGSNEGTAIRTVSSIGGAPLEVLSLPYPVHGLDWSPDNRSLVFSTRDAEESPDRIILFSFETRDTLYLTEPVDRSEGDRYPAFSPDGCEVAFVRHGNGQQSDLFVTNLAESEPRRITFLQHSIKSLDWTPDGGRLIFSSGPDMAGEFCLRTASLEDGTLLRLVSRELRAVYPSIARSVNSLVYERQILNLDISRMPLGEEPGFTDSLAPRINSTRSDWGVRFSPRGNRIAFISTRSGGPNLWLCDGDGKNLRILTSFDNAFVSIPRWSFDEKRIAFNTTQDGHSLIYIMDVENGELREVPVTGPHNMVMCWSRDGEWLYYKTEQDGRWETRKIRTDGDETRLVTAADVYHIQESLDGTELYFTKSVALGLWKMPVEGGAEKPVVRDPENTYRSFWKVTDKGICFLRRTPGGGEIALHDPDTGEESTLSPMPVFTFALDVSRDGKWVIYDRTVNTESDLIFVKNFP